MSFVEIDLVIMKIKKKNVVKVLLLFRYKRSVPSFEQTWFPFTQGCLVPSLVEISLVVLEKKIL